MLLKHHSFNLNSPAGRASVEELLCYPLGIQPGIVRQTKERFAPGTEHQSVCVEFITNHSRTREELSLMQSDKPQHSGQITSPSGSMGHSLPTTIPSQLPRLARSTMQSKPPDSGKKSALIDPNSKNCTLPTGVPTNTRGIADMGEFGRETDSLVPMRRANESMGGERKPLRSPIWSNLTSNKTRNNDEVIHTKVYSTNEKSDMPGITPNRARQQRPRINSNTPGYATNSFPRTASLRSTCIPYNLCVNLSRSRDISPARSVPSHPDRNQFQHLLGLPIEERVGKKKSCGTNHPTIHAEKRAQSVCGMMYRSMPSTTGQFTSLRRSNSSRLTSNERDRLIPNRSGEKHVNSSRTEDVPFDDGVYQEEADLKMSTTIDRSSTKTPVDGAKLVIDELRNKFQVKHSSLNQKTNPHYVKTLSIFGPETKLIPNNHIIMGSPKAATLDQKTGLCYTNALPSFGQETRLIPNRHSTTGWYETSPRTRVETIPPKRQSTQLQNPGVPCDAQPVEQQRPKSANVGSEFSDAIQQLRSFLKPSHLMSPPEKINTQPTSLSEKYQTSNSQCHRGFPQPKLSINDPKPTLRNRTNSRVTNNLEPNYSGELESCKQKQRNAQTISLTTQSFDANSHSHHDHSFDYSSKDCIGLQDSIKFESRKPPRTETPSLHHSFDKVALPAFGKQAFNTLPRQRKGSKAIHRFISRTAPSCPNQSECQSESTGPDEDFEGVIGTDNTETDQFSVLRPSILNLAFQLHRQLRNTGFLKGSTSPGDEGKTNDMEHQDTSHQPSVNLEQVPDVKTSISNPQTLLDGAVDTRRRGCKSKISVRPEYSALAEKLAKQFQMRVSPTHCSALESCVGRKTASSLSRPEENKNNNSNNSTLIDNPRRSQSAMGESAITRSGQTDDARNDGTRASEVKAHSLNSIVDRDLEPVRQKLLMELTEKLAKRCSSTIPQESRESGNGNRATQSNRTSPVPAEMESGDMVPDLEPSRPSRPMTVSSPPTLSTSCSVDVDASDGVIEVSSTTSRLIVSPSATFWAPPVFTIPQPDTARGCDSEHASSPVKHQYSNTVQLSHEWFHRNKPIGSDDVQTNTRIANEIVRPVVADAAHKSPHAQINDASEQADQHNFIDSPQCQHSEQPSYFFSTEVSTYSTDSFLSNSTTLERGQFPRPKWEARAEPVMEKPWMRVSNIRRFPRIVPNQLTQEMDSQIILERPNSAPALPNNKRVRPFGSLNIPWKPLTTHFP